MNADKIGELTERVTEAAGEVFQAEGIGPTDPLVAFVYIAMLATHFTMAGGTTEYLENLVTQVREQCASCAALYPEYAALKKAN